ncbi:hypothetical protein JIN85_05615 [Luteolibacter pohnpeiensis]|uniref:DUF4034 domain-containing protein n=1 Tax=Luteolibacter pohnpeiensis TaxID=454153 RepID=A0A934S6V5_9BACT|nr:hypothetical protein [Luteolibacter pohnpeiensis]MBK1881881.1 hypothetical protein [Luteolibacter pohnpeiensis]
MDRKAVRLVRHPMLAGLGGCVIGVLLFYGLDQRAGQNDSSNPSERTDRPARRPVHRASTPASVSFYVKRFQQIALQNEADSKSLALEIIRTRDKSRMLELEMAFQRWMSFEKPLDLLDKLPTLVESDNAGFWAEPFFKAWAAKDYPMAMALSSDMGIFSHCRFLTAIEYQDPAVWNYAESGLFGLYDREAVQSGLFRLGRDRPDLLRGLEVDRIPAIALSEVVTGLAKGWASVDPNAALAWLQSLPIDDDARKWATAAMQAKLSKSDAPAADPFMDVTDLYQKLEKDGDALPSLWSTLVTGSSWYPTDPELAAKQAEALPPGKIRDTLMNAIAYIWCAQDPDAAYEFAQRNGLRTESLPMPLDRDQLERIASEPRAAFTDLLKAAKENPRWVDTYHQELMEWARVQPEEMADWLWNEWNQVDLTHVSSSESFQLGQFIAYQWAQYDATGAVDWVETLPDGPAKSSVWSSMMFDAARYEPERAFDLTMKIETGEGREKLLHSALEWMVRNAGKPSALAHLNEADLGDEERASLRRFVMEGNGSN